MIETEAKIGKVPNPAGQVAADEANGRGDLQDHLFASTRHPPRRRRASDVARLLAASAAFGLLGWAMSNTPPIDLRVANFFSQLPDWLRTLGWIGYTGAAIVTVGLVALTLITGGVARGVLRDLASAALLVALLGAITARLVAQSWPELIPELVNRTDGPSYPTLRTALVATMAGVLAVYVTYPVQRLMNWTVVAAVVSPFILGLTTLTAMCGALSLAMLSVAAVRLAFGSPEGLPPVGRLHETIERIGVDVPDLSYLPDQPGTVGLAEGRSTDGRRCRVKVFGQDAASRMRAERVWNALWYRNAGLAPRAGRVEQAQHEALALLVASRAGVGVTELIGTGRDAGGDVLLVTVQPPGSPLGNRTADDLDDEPLRAIWQNLGVLHRDARMAHGWIGPHNVLLDEKHVTFTNFDYSATMPTDQQLATDVVSLLATTATIVGEDRALDAATETVAADHLAVALPYLHEAVVEPALRRSVTQADVSFGSLRSKLAERLEVDEPELQQVRRVSWSDVLIVVFAIIAANALIAQIVDVGLDTLLDTLRTASIAWLVAAFGIKLISYTTAHMGLKAVVARPLPFGPTTLLQPARAFIGLVVPFGRVGVDIRFLQQLGVPTTVAATQGPLVGAIGFLSEILLLLLSAWWIGQAIDTTELFGFDASGLLLIAVIVVVVGLATVFLVPRFRDKVLPVVKEAFQSVTSIITSPARFGQIFLSEALRRLFGAVALGATMAAFHAHVPFAALIFVSIGTGMLASLAPVPGGIGVAEATMSGLLIGVGVDPALSVSIAVTHRIVTSYLPPVLGYFSLNWLTKEGYL